MKEKYPRCKEIGFKIVNGCVSNEEYARVAGLKGTGWDYTFSKLFGIQTQCEDGMYVHDVKAVLERMKTGKLTGSQLLWD